MKSFKFIKTLFSFLLLFSVFSFLGSSAYGATITQQISSPSNDVNEDGGSYTNSSALWLGNGQSTSNSWAGLRFQNVEIPQGADITQAILEVNSQSSQWISISLDITGDAAGDSAPFSSANRPSSRLTTLSSTVHNSNTLWSTGTWYQVADVSSIIEEIISNPSWSQGNNFSLLLQGSGGAWGRKFVHSVNTDPLLAPRLIITYEVEQDPTPTPTTTPTSTPTPTPQPTTTPTSTPTPTPQPGFGKCGEYTDRWHPPVIDQAYVDKWGVGEVGCEVGHEHGQEEPQWLQDWLLTNEGRDHILFGGPSATPHENEHKHEAYFILCGTFEATDMDMCRLWHAQTNPHGRAGGGYRGALHSNITYAQDTQGGVTRISGWLDFSPADMPGVRVGLGEERPENTGHIIAARPGQTLCESWYNGGHSLLPNGGLFICNQSVFFYDDEINYSSLADIDEWDTTGFVGNSRGWDNNWYEGQLGNLRGETFWSDQFGRFVSGPTDSDCGSFETVYGVSTEILCLEQIVSPTWTDIEFPDNNRINNVTFPSQGVVLPN